ncbi:Type I HSP40 co-chaperone [Lambiella insularis]|nr:Type I HSP40 co-chaperone [Lambiella insularis]
MVKETKFYELLEVHETCTDAQLKTAYKKGALRHHPDKNRDNPAAAEKFKDISRAYEVLSDPQKRQVYDQYGEAGLSEQGGAGGMNAEDLFSQFFGGGGLGSMFGGQMRDTGPKKARTIHHVHKVSLEDIYNGKKSKLALQKSIICPSCKGKGGKEGAVKTCTGCNGQGMKTMMRQMGPMIQRFQTVCPDCQGEGEMIRDKDRCRQCKGKKTDVERKVLTVECEIGIPNGYKKVFSGEGDQVPGVEAGDVVFEFEEKPHPRFVRKGNDLYYKAQVSLYTALVGGKFQLQHLDAPEQRWLTVNINPGEIIEPGARKMIPDQGMLSHVLRDPGNLYIEFDIKFPTVAPELEDHERDILKKILGYPIDPRSLDHKIIQKAKNITSPLKPKPKTKDPNGMDIDEEAKLPLEMDPFSPPIKHTKEDGSKISVLVEEVDIEDIDHSAHGRSARATMEDEDEDGMPAGGERVQCGTQ